MASVTTKSDQGWDSVSKYIERTDHDLTSQSDRIIDIRRYCNAYISALIDDLSSEKEICLAISTVLSPGKYGRKESGKIMQAIHACNKKRVDSLRAFSNDMGKYNDLLTSSNKALRHNHEQLTSHIKKMSKSSKDRLQVASNVDKVQVDTAQKVMSQITNTNSSCGLSKTTTSHGENCVNVKCSLQTFEIVNPIPETRIPESSNGEIFSSASPPRTFRRYNDGHYMEDGTKAILATIQQQGNQHKESINLLQHSITVKLEGEIHGLKQAVQDLKSKTEILQRNSSCKPVANVSTLPFLGGMGSTSSQTRADNFQKMESASHKKNSNNVELLKKIESLRSELKLLQTDRAKLNDDIYSEQLCLPKPRPWVVERLERFQCVNQRRITEVKNELAKFSTSNPEAELQPENMHDPSGGGLSENRSSTRHLVNGHTNNNQQQSWSNEMYTQQAIFFTPYGSFAMPVYQPPVMFPGFPAMYPRCVESPFGGLSNGPCHISSLWNNKRKPNRRYNRQIPAAPEGNWRGFRST